MLTENADLIRKAASKIFPVNQSIFGVPRATRDLTILGRERQSRLRKTKTIITGIKAVKLYRNHNLKDLYPNIWPHTFLKSSTTFYNVKSICFQLE